MMNFVFLSPHFPVQMSYFARALAASGRFCVLGVSDASICEVGQDIRWAFADWVQLPSLEDYDAVYRAVAALISRHGRICFIESLNEHWLRLEARLREDFNVQSGWTAPQIMQLQMKSVMKARFEAAGVPVAPWCVPRSFADVATFAQRNGFPLFAKPDSGVGAECSYKLMSDADIRRFVAEESSNLANGAFILETFLNGGIVSYDGLTALDGRVVMSSSLQYEATPYDVLSHVVSQRRFAYWVHPRPLPEVAALGEAAVKAFGLRGRFFHIEFMWHNGKLHGLEANLRTPGAPTTDLWNFAMDADCYSLYARVLAGERVVAANQQQTAAAAAAATVTPTSQGWISVFCGRMAGVKYKHSAEEIGKRFGNQLVARYHLTPAYARLMGEDAFVVRVRTKNDIPEVISIVGDEYRAPELVVVQQVVTTSSTTPLPTTPQPHPQPQQQQQQQTTATPSTASSRKVNVMVAS